MDVDLDLGTLAHPADVSRHHFDLLTTLADDETGTRGVEGDPNTVPGTLDDDPRNSTLLKAALEIAANPEVGMELVGVVALGRIPTRLPVFANGEPETDRMYFLSHNKIR